MKANMHLTWRRGLLFGLVICVLGGLLAWGVVSVAGSDDDTVGATAAPSDQSAARRPRRPPPGGYFHLLKAGARLPSGSRCAARVHRSAWEPRPANKTANHTVPHQPVSIGRFSQYTEKWNSRYRPRVTGNFKGTTDEIIQWAACKWGWPDDLIRAQAVRESNWEMKNQGDYEPRSRGHCTYDDRRSPCPTSFGILQIKWYFHPVVSNPRVGSSYPAARNSTAFNIDLQVAEMRGCYDGLSTYLGNTRGDLWGCIGYWYTGAWHTSAGTDYAKDVRHKLDAKAWLKW